MDDHHSDGRLAFSRRGFVSAGLGLGAALAAGLGPPGVRSAAAQAARKPPEGIHWKTIPRTDERVPAIGLGSIMTFDLIPGQKRDHLREVMRRVWEGGGRVFDTSPLYGMGEVNVGALATGLGIADEMFVSNKIWSTGDHLGDPAHARRSLETSPARLWRGKIDVMSCHNLVNVDGVVPLVQAWKKEGLVRHVGVSHHETDYFDSIAEWIVRGKLDFVQIRYSMSTRQAEQAVLRIAAERGTGVLVAMPFEKARLLKIVEGRPLPDFARVLAVTSWPQYFLKWVISHPAVTCALPATSNPEHAADNIAALRGPLPDPKLRDRMLAHVQKIPGFNDVEKMPWYPDKRYQGVIKRSMEASAPRPGR